MCGSVYGSVWNGFALDEMNSMELASKYALQIRDLALQADAGEDMIEALNFTLSHAKRDLGSVASAPAAACQQQLFSFMRDISEGASAVMYNAVLNWAIRDLEQS